MRRSIRIGVAALTVFAGSLWQGLATSDPGTNLVITGLATDSSGTSFALVRGVDGLVSEGRRIAYSTEKERGWIEVVRIDVERREVETRRVDVVLFLPKPMPVIPPEPVRTKGPRDPFQPVGYGLPGTGESTAKE